ncbi:MAG: efflux RND transporter periplasmic adaptor subunit [Arcobacteraceae bacterium]|nr:efflux RND transporter periplasmic adaptor subunit [Arcobacteraceae bacterium]
MYKIVVFIVLIFFVGCSSEEKKEKKQEIVSVLVTKPIEQKIEKSIKFHGNVESPKVVQIKNRIDGFLDKQYFRDGEFVKAGQMLYKIDDKLLKTELSSLTAQQKQAEVNLTNLKNIKERNERMLLVNAKSQQDVDTVVTAYEQQKYAIDIIKANIDKVNANLSYTYIKAPISGYIEKSQFNEGAFVPSSGTFLTNIYQSSPLYFLASIPPQSQKFEKVLVEFDDFNVTAKLAFCDPSVDLSSGLLKCRFEFQTNKKIPINSFGKIKLLSKKSAMFIPQTAISQGKSSKIVFTVKDNKAFMKNVVLGDWSGDMIEVVSGLNFDDVVVSEGIANLRDKSPVKIGK